MTNTVLRYEVLRRDEYTCQACGRSAPEVTLEVDHIRPVALGGLDIPENLQALCRDCNRGKSATPSEAAMAEAVRDRHDEWVIARAEAAHMIANEQARLDPLIEAFELKWSRWHYGDAEPIPRHAEWEITLRDFLMRGLTESDMLSLVDRAGQSCKGAGTMWGRYYHLCLNRVELINERASQILSQRDQGKWVSYKDAAD